jgi:hypothetical protein
MKNFLTTYQELNADNLHRLDEIYSEKIHFIDPAHEIHGLERLRSYFAGLYREVQSISFQFNHPVNVDNEAYLQWLMSLQHPKLQGGHTISIPGASYLRFTDNGKVDHHRDYFDLGAMLYEQLPLLGTVIRTLKRRLSS